MNPPKLAPPAQPNPASQPPRPTTPPRINNLHGFYKPETSTPIRLGAMDFKAIASRGVRC